MLLIRGGARRDFFFFLEIELRRLPGRRLGGMDRASLLPGGILEPGAEIWRWRPTPCWGQRLSPDPGAPKKDGVGRWILTQDLVADKVKRKFDPGINSEPQEKFF